MPDLYEPNDSLGGGAANLGVVSTALSIPNLSIDSYNDDWFQFQTTGSGSTNVEIGFDHALGDLDLRVLDVNGTWLGSSTSSSNNETVNLSYLPAGTYYAQIYGWNGASNPNYSLTISPTSGAAIDDPYEENDFIGTGDLGLLQGWNPYYGLVLQSNDEDWFQFETANTGTLNVRLDFLNDQGDLDFELYNSANELVGSSATSGDVEQISIPNAAAGTYNARVIGYNGASNPYYSLTVDAPTATTVDDRYEPNDSLGGAAQLQLQNGQFSDNSLILAANDDDWFQFTVPQNPSPGSNISANLVNSIATLGLTLYDQNGNWVNSSYNFSNGYSNGATIPLDYLTPGTYYADVWGYSDYANPANPNAAPITYGLSINATSAGSGNNNGIADSLEEDDTRETATPISLGYYGNIANIQSNDPDWYRFDLPGNQAPGSNITINFQNSLGDLDFYLYDQNNNWVGSSTSGSNDTESILLSGLGAGTYYAQVIGWAGATNPNYELTLNATTGGTTVTDDRYEENDSLGGAKQLELSNGQFSANNLVANDDDWFQFTVPQNPIPGSNINIGFSNAQGNLDLYLYDQSGNYVSGSYNWWDGETIYLDSLPGGTYYAQVTGYGGTNPNYSLNINAIGGTAPTTGGDDPFEDNDLQTSATILPVGQQTFIALRALDDDWYKFTLNSPAQASDYVSIDFQHNLGDLDLEVLTPTGQYLGSYGVSNTETISLVGQPAGDYYIHAYGYAGATNNYNLNVVTSTSSSPINNTGDDQFEENDTSDQATDLQTKLLSGESSFTDLKINSNDDDWFKFTTTQIGGLNDKITINSTQSGDLDLEVYDSNGQVVGGSYSFYANEEVSLAYLPAGEYKVRVYGYAGASNSSYGLSITAPVTSSSAAGIQPDFREPNDSRETASLVLNNAIIPSLNIHAANNEDWFKFNLGSAGLSSHQVIVNGFEHSLGDIDVQLYDAAGTFLRSSGSTSNSESISLEGLIPGEYYVKVFGYAGATNPQYQLQVDAPVADPNNPNSNPGNTTINRDNYEDNDTFETASNLGTTRSADPTRVVSAIQDQIDLTDLTLEAADDDWFKFRKTSAGNVDVRLTFEHDYGDVDLEVRDSNNQLIGQSQGTSDTETVSFNAAAQGTYYVRAYGYEGATNPNYRLQITPTFGNGGSLDVAADQFEPGNNERTGATVLQDLTSTQGSLSIHNPTDVDWFKFTPAGNSTENNQIFINYDSVANLNLELYDQAGNPLSNYPVVSQPDSGLASISLAGLPGDGNTPYYAKVSGANPSPYSLSLNAPETASVNPGTSTDQWTIMVYIAGDNNLAAAGLDDINEMESIGLPDNVNVVVQYDGAPGYVSSNWVDTRRGVIQQDFNTSTVSSNLTSLGELNMGDPQTLTDFIQWGKNNYAAQNYAVVVWDHGGGRSGVAWDETSGNANLSVSELTSAISNAGLGDSLQVVGLDACLMALTEATYDLKNLTDVFVGAQNPEPGDGWDYAGWFQRLADGGGRLDAEQMGGAIVDAYGEFYNNSETQSAIRTSALDNLKAKLDAFVDATANASDSDWQAITQARSEARTFYIEDERDLGGFMQAVDNRLDGPIGDAARQVSQALQAAVINQVNYSGANGLSIYLPPVNGSGYQSTYNGNNFHFAADTKWTQFLTAFASRDRAVASNRSQRITPDAAETTDLSGNITGNQNNNSASAAYYLGNLAGSEYTFSNLNLDTADDQDWYRFKIEGDGTDGNSISLVSATTAGLTLELYKAGDNGSLAVNSAAVATGTQSVSLAGQTAGTYFVRVAGNAPNPEYSLKVNAPAAAISRGGEGITSDALEGNGNNNSQAKAHDLGELGPNDSLSIPGLSITTGDTDWYMITPTRIPERYPNAITINFDNAQGDLDLQLYKADGTLIDSSLTSDRNYESISFPTGNDPVYIKVAGKDGATNPNYTLDVVRRELDIDGNGAADALTDGLLSLSSLFGFTEDSLTDGKVASDGQRIYPDEISNYLEQAQTNMLDVDGNGTPDALTDGVIQLAYLFGFRGDQLANPAYLGTGATRTTSQELEEFLGLYMPPIASNNSVSLI
ncbi:pre-peptidase C-terminal domain-containing protein [Planktothrix mougeotii]|uniref:Pre-peptidase C-terminal domain-containing protein n=1 Tax=Planktothrix mougeotii LEGE 06226 TaxID=1828728 RepID=A0ABR9UG36_9CYAN|nr:pre-peptidase C-terminal domain-containing protein [Planktothrix mougeotii]MBE9145418.1 pre-peptidase C-terminal domain-containing protein [Planktothrix mougeotii LEGE 06226]